MTPLDLILTELRAAGAPSSLIVAIEEAHANHDDEALERAMRIAQAWLTYTIVDEEP